jgi:hypothetical protein
MSNPLKENQYIQALGFTIAVFGAIEFAIGVLIRNTVKSFFGVWWAGLSAVASGISIMMQGTQQQRNFGFCSCILGLLTVIAGSIVDGTGNVLVSRLDTCGNEENEFFGDKSLAAINQVLNCGGREDFDCVCVDTSREDSCVAFNLVRHRDNCYQILGYYDRMLYNSVRCLNILLVVLIVCCIFQSTIRLCGDCCKPFCLPGCCESPNDDPIVQQQVVVIHDHNAPPEGVVYLRPQVVIVQQQPAANTGLKTTHEKPHQQNTSNAVVHKEVNQV